MPIYEYQAQDPARACPHCRAGFELVHPAGEAPCVHCPECGRPVRKLLSRVGVRVAASGGERSRVMEQIRGYEKEGKWSHAAELADTHSARTEDPGLKSRALDNYKKAGLDPD